MFSEKDWTYLDSKLKTKLIVRELKRQMDDSAMREISGGLGGGIGNRWFKNYQNEVFSVTKNGETLFEKEGDQKSVDLTDIELAKIKDCDISHTHTTPVGGTFSSEDIEVTVVGWVLSHTVTATVTHESYRLERTDKATKDTGNRFFKAFSSYERSKREDIRYKIWQSEYESRGIESPLVESDLIRAELELKIALHQWLEEHAEDYGYLYKKL
ncbi:hypothetical protein EGYY_25280 [Eggerthella sp. YY7918]|nr:hypothetical protein EGYY_25280 [Eggerthella sp. YY7918]